MALWDKIGSSGNVEDRRGMGPGGLALGGGGLVGLVLTAAMMYLSGSSGGDILSQILSQSTGQGGLGQAGDTSQYTGKDDYEVFASKVLGSANDVWRQELGSSYRDPKLVLFRNVTSSACGNATSQVGPHYCPTDETIYLDETFFDELTTRLGAKGGDVAQGYVIAHEVGHHVQKLNGALDKAQRSGALDNNAVSVRTELQADCYAGIWANGLAGEGVFENGEINEAIDAAAAVGDDRIQAKTQGQINPETWTHGSSEQRASSFNRGYQSGDAAQCTAL